jgi:Bacterial Ig-like domain (group 2)
VALSDSLQLVGTRLRLFYLIAIFCFLVSGCKSSSSTPPASTSTTTPGALATMKITASPLTIATNATDQFTATGADSSGNAISSLTVAWSSSAPNVATIDQNSGLATAVAPGVTAITASFSGITSNTLFLTVTAPLKGQYAFLLQGFDDATGDQVAMIGSFTADGTNVISAGLEDINGPNGFSEVTFTGTYTTDAAPPDNRGRIIITNSNGAFTEFTFAAGSLSGGVPTSGKIIEFDDSTGTGSERAAGAFYLQNTSDFALSFVTGPYALQFSGQRPASGSREVTTGAFMADGNGGFSSGNLDINAPPAGPSATPQSFTATLTANSTTTTNTSTNGQFLLSFTSGPSVNGVVYVVSSAQALFMETDSEGSHGLEAGQILAQTSSPFSNTSLNGMTVEYEQGLGTTAGQPLAAIGLINFGASPISVSRDIDDSGMLDGGTTTPETSSLTFSTVASNGRVVLMNGASESAIVYLVSPNQGFMMSATPSATVGFFQPQASGPFSVASINGSYFGGTVPPAVPHPMAIASDQIPVVNETELTSAGNGFASFSLDVSLNGGPGRSLLQGEQGGLSVLFSGGTTTGRAIDNAGDIYYIIGPSSFLMLVPNAAGPSSANPPPPPSPVIDVFQQ